MPLLCRAWVLLECTKWKDDLEKLAHVRLPLAFPKRPSFEEAGIMDHKKTSNHHGRLNRRSFLDAAGRLAEVDGFGRRPHLRDDHFRLEPAAGKRGTPEFRRVVDRLKTRLSFLDFGRCGGPWIWV